MDSSAAAGNDNDRGSSLPPSDGVTMERVVDVDDEPANGRPVGRRRGTGTGTGRGSSPNTFIGKHRLAAAINQINLQIQFIQEELEQLETLGASSLVCKEFISSVESNADALLPMTKGPGDAGWDRWFQGTHNSRNRKRWI